MRRFLFSALAALCLSANSPQAEALSQQLHFTTGYSALSGSALDGDEAPGGAYGIGHLSTGLTSQNGWQLLGSLTLTGVDASGYDDSYLRASAVELGIRGDLGRAQIGGFVGILHSEQDQGTWRSSRRMYLGLGLEQPLANGSISASLGYLRLNGGTDGKGVESLSDAPFLTVAYRHQVTKDAALRATADYATGRVISAGARHRAFVRAVGFSYLHQINTTTELDFGLRFTGYQAAGKSLAERQVFLGLTHSFGRKAIHSGPRPLARWVGQTGGPLF